MQTLVELGVTNKALVEHGLRSARASGWVRPPSAGQFCNWAWDAAQKSEGIPTLAEAQSMIIRRLNRPSFKFSPAMSHVSMKLDWFEIRRAKLETVNGFVATAYSKMIEHWKSGRPFLQPTESDAMTLEDKSHLRKELTPEQRSMGVSEMQKILGAL